jgi:hypothetical protein
MRGAEVRVKPRTTPGKADTEGSTLTIKDLLSYGNHPVSSLLSRSAAVRYHTQFDLSPGEWRDLALLGGCSPMALNQLAREADLHKAQMGRGASGLVKNGYVTRKTWGERPSPAARIPVSSHAR